MHWPFRRRSTPEPSPVAGGNSMDVRAAWEDLPPLQRSTEDLAPVAPAASFRESLSAHQDPRFLAPLGHALTVDAPAGEIGNYAQPVPVEQRQEFTLPPSAANFSTTGSGAASPLVQRAAEQLPPVQRAADQFPPVQRAAEGSSPVQHAVDGSAPIQSSAEGAAPLQRGAGGFASVQREADGFARVERAGESSAPVQRAMEGFAPIQRSAEWSASSQRSAEQSASVNRAAGDFVAVKQATGDSAVLQRAVEGPAPVQKSAEGFAPVQRTAEGLEPVQGPAESSVPVQRTAEGSGSVQGSGEGFAPVQRAFEGSGGSASVQRAAGGFEAGRRMGEGIASGRRGGEGGAAVRGLSGDGGVVQRAVDGASAVVRTFSLPAVGGATGGRAGELPVIEARSAPVVEVPMVQSSFASAGLPVVSRVVESPQNHREHAAAGDGGQHDSVQPVVEQVPLVGAVGQSPFVSALGGPEDDGEIVQRAEEGHDGLPVVGGGGAVSRVEFPVQRVVDERVPESSQVELLAGRTGELGPVAQRAAEAQSVLRADDGRFVQRAGDVGSVQRVGDQPVVRRPLVGELGVPTSVGGGSAASGSVDGGEVAQRVAGGVAELLWPPPVRAVADAVVPLSSAAPLTVPGAQETVNSASVAPAVQRVVYDHPGLRAPSSSRTGAVPSSQLSAVQAVGQAQNSSVTEAPQEQVLSWSAGESFHAGPAVQRIEAESVKAVSLQQMFAGQATPESVVQRDEAPAAAVQAAPDQAAPAQAGPVQAAAAAPGKAVSAAEVEELAKRLYEPLTAKLRAELWLDRERAGRVTDRWH